MSKRLFSVAISVYGKDDPKYLDRALRSILDEQTIKPNEVVLIVDGPIPDAVDQVIEQYVEKYPIFQIIRLPHNRGLGTALRLAVENCHHELVARMDSDDISLPTRFEQQIRAFDEDGKLDIIGGDIIEFIGSEENAIAERVVPKDDADIKEYMKTRCPLNHVSVMFRKAAVLDSGSYLNLFWNEDYYLWIRMAEHGCRMANTGTVLVNVRVGSDMYQRRGGRRYFLSEKFLQDYMYKHQMINVRTYIMNIHKRWIVQCVLPYRIRGWVFRTFARKKHERH